MGILRVFIVGLSHYFNRVKLKNKFSSLTITSFIGILFLLVDYRLAYQDSYFVGFSLSLGLKFIQPSLNLFKKKKRIIAYPIIIYFLLLPKNIASGSWHVLSLLFQHALIPINEFYIIVSLISFYLNLPFSNIISFLSNVLGNIYSLIYRFDIAIPIGDILTNFFPIYYILFYYIIYLLEGQRTMHLKYGAIPLVSSLCISLIPVRLLLFNAIYFINVGQGDSILIQNRNKTVLIDTGGIKNFDMAEEVLIPFFNRKQIYQIDLLVTTHDDYDHSGAASSLMKHFPVKEYRKEREEFPYQIGDIYLDNLNTYNGLSENDKSLVFNLSFMGKKWLLTGDAEKEVEKFLIDENIDIDCDILKVGHHGSSTSSTEEFIKAASPEVAIISVGAGNSYGHPNDNVLQILNKYNVKIRRTDLEGTISFIQFAS